MTNTMYTARSTRALSRSSFGCASQPQLAARELAARAECTGESALGVGRFVSGMKRVLWSVCAGALLTASAVGQPQSPYTRVVDRDDHTVELDVAVRMLVPDDSSKPILSLVGAVHIADDPFYVDMQKILDVHDLVLFEGVGSGHKKDEPERTGNDATTTTIQRLAFLQVLRNLLVSQENKTIHSVGDMTSQYANGMHKLLTMATVDGWGHPIGFDTTRDTFVSYGADGSPGGTGADADLYAAGDMLSPFHEEDPQYAGLQRDLAKALGLTFQLDGIDYSHPNWRNSDLSIDKIREALGAEPQAEGDAADNGGGGADGARGGGDDGPEALKAADTLFRTLSGDSFLAKFSTFFLKMIGSSPSGRALVKIMLAEALSHADGLLAAQPGAISELMDVIIKDRNAAVIHDLKKVLATEPDVRSVAIFYGAGHFGDLESRIQKELGYTYKSTLWVPAITIDIDKAGISSGQVKLFRKMISQMIQTQLDTAKKRK